MPKPHTFPTLYNEALQIHISKLKGWGYLDPKQIKSGTVNWSRNGNPTGSISIQAKKEITSVALSSATSDKYGATFSQQLS